MPQRKRTAPSLNVSHWKAGGSLSWARKPVRSIGPSMILGKKETKRAQSMKFRSAFALPACTSDRAAMIWKL